MMVKAKERPSYTIVVYRCGGLGKWKSGSQGGKCCRASLLQSFNKRILNFV
ncbi:MAG: hypothetical protein ACJAQ4_001957 [Cryomorphaceae bacterium]|jgi:hypothetical protein